MSACPQCRHHHVVKAGKVGDQQRWRCRGCGEQCTRPTPRGRPLWQKSLAGFLYCHGVSINALGHMFGVHASSVLKWLRCDATAPDDKPAPAGKAVVMEVDEMGHFLKKNAPRSGGGRLVIAIQAASLTGSGGVVRQQPCKRWSIV